FQFFLKEARDSFEIPKHKEYVEFARDYCQLAGIELPEFQPQNTKGDGNGDQEKSKNYQLGEEDDNPPPLLLAKNLANFLQNKLVYDDGTKQWMLYQQDIPGAFSCVSDERLQKKIIHLLEKWNYKPYSIQYLNNTIKFLRALLLEPVWNERSPSEMIPFQNGVLEVKTGKLLPHSPDYRFTWGMPREHDSNAKDWSKINTFLEQATQGNKQIKLILICFLNAILKGRSDLQKFLHLIGAGGSGKGTFTRLASDLIGQSNVHSSSLEDWCGNRFETANALNKRLLVFADEDKKVGALSRFKQLTGQDNLRAEEKGKKAFSFTYDGMVMVASNFPIFAGDSSSGLSRRLILVPFNNVPTPGDRRQLNAEFQSELSAFTNYLLSISDEEVTRTLLETKEIAELNAEFWDARQRTDSIAAWVNDQIIFDAEAITPIGKDKNEGKDGNRPQTLFGSYCLHAQQSGTQAKSVKNFSPDLVELCSRILGKPVQRVALRNGKFIKGLRLRRNEDFDIPTYETQLENLQKLERYKSCYESVTSDVTSKILTVQGCYECDESNQFFNKVLEKKEDSSSPVQLADIVPSSDREVEKTDIAASKCDLSVTLVTSPENKGFQPSHDPSPTRHATRNNVQWGHPVQDIFSDPAITPPVDPSEPPSAEPLWTKQNLDPYEVLRVGDRVTARWSDDYMQAEIIYISSTNGSIKLEYRETDGSFKWTLKRSEVRQKIVPPVGGAA
ncbi:MAG: phage/plasmid primase, P4 family, partial [Snowella sp.]|nr:phage/plasmid primase, P4 family [Snowella sp.]